MVKSHPEDGGEGGIGCLRVYKQFVPDLYSHVFIESPTKPTHTFRSNFRCSQSILPLRHVYDSMLKDDVLKRGVSCRSKGESSSSSSSSSEEEEEEEGVGGRGGGENKNLLWK